MNKRLFGLVGMLLSLVFVLAACGTSTLSTTSTNGQGTPIAGSSNALGTPVARGTNTMATPGASPMATQTTNLAAAFSNLQSQNSYVMTAKLSNVQGTFANFTGKLQNATLKVERSGNDRHMTITDNNGNTLFQLWQVNGSVWADLGSGPTKIASNNSMVSQFVSMLGYEQQIINSLESKDANYAVIGTQSVNNMQTVVENARYQLNAKTNSNMFFNNANGTVESKIWVSQSGNYLVRADFVVSAAASNTATPTSGTPVSSTMTGGTPTAVGSAQVMINVTNIGQVQSIQPPS